MSVRSVLVRVAFAATLGIATAFVASACQVPNPEHCSNQDQPGNDYCAGVNSATPFCSPCHEKNHGCLPFEPISCESYMGESGGPGPGPGSASDSSTSD